MNHIEASSSKTAENGRRSRAGGRSFRIVCITQVFNEIRKGNLYRFLDHILPVVDELVVYDDGSTDGTTECVTARTPHVIRGARNEFDSEIAHKQLLLDKALTLGPDFILWLDADEVLTAGAAEALQRLCASCTEEGLDGIALHELNLWRSRTWRRTDSLYGEGWFVRLWRVTEGMRYEPSKGLHLPQHPVTVERIARAEDLAVLHYGFSDECNLAHKYITYRAHGKRGYEMLGRLISEEHLVVERVGPDLIPGSLWVDEPAPSPMSFAESLAFVETHRQQVQRPGFSIVCLLPRSCSEAWFCCEQVLGFTDMSAKEFLFVVDGRSTAMMNSLGGSYLPYFAWNGWSDDQPAYSLLRLVSEVATGDFVLLLHPRTRLSLDWLDAMFAAYSAGKIVSSRTGSWLDRANARALPPMLPLLLRADDLQSGLSAHSSAAGTTRSNESLTRSDMLDVSLQTAVIDLALNLGLTHRIAPRSDVRRVPHASSSRETQSVAAARQPVVRITPSVPPSSRSIVWNALQRLMSEQGSFESATTGPRTAPPPREIAIAIQGASDTSREDGAHIVIRVATDQPPDRVTDSLAPGDYLLCETLEDALWFPEEEYDIVDSPRAWRRLLERATQQALSEVLAREREGMWRVRYVHMWREASSRLTHAVRSLRPSMIRSWLQEELAPVLRRKGLLKPALAVWRLFRLRRSR